LEQTYKFKLETFLSPNNVSTKGLGFAGLALVSAQKIFLFLGDLARYKEQVNETSNFGKSRQCYIKAHQINPKNGRPYNQLAILAVYAVSMIFFVISIIIYGMYVLGELSQYDDCGPANWGLVPGRGRDFPLCLL
jgi:hypothetical protein